MRSYRHRRQTNGYRPQTLNSVCEGVSVRGTEKQIADKWIRLAEDYDKTQDNVTAERFRQQAEHYVRLQNSIQKDLQNVNQ